MKNLTITLLTLIVLGGCSEPVTHFNCVHDDSRYQQFDLTYRASGEFYALEKTWLIIETTDHNYEAEAPWDYDPSIAMSRWNRLSFNRIGEEHIVVLSTSQLGRELLEETGFKRVEFYTCKETTRF